MEEERSDWICLTPLEFYQAILCATEEGKGFGQQSSSWHNHMPGENSLERDSSVLNVLIHLAQDWGSILSTHHGSSQPSVIPVTGHPTPSSSLLRYQTCTWCTYIHTCRQNTHEHKNELQRKKSIQAVQKASLGGKGQMHLGLKFSWMNGVMVS